MHAHSLLLWSLACPEASAANVALEGRIRGSCRPNANLWSKWYGLYLMPERCLVTVPKVGACTAWAPKQRKPYPLCPPASSWTTAGHKQGLLWRLACACRFLGWGTVLELSRHKDCRVQKVNPQFGFRGQLEASQTGIVLMMWLGLPVDSSVFAAAGVSLVKSYSAHGLFRTL